MTFQSGESLTSVLSGFTVRNGFASSSSQYPAGGISIGNSSPTITGNVVTKNIGCGIGVYYGAPLIEHNTISYTYWANFPDCAPSYASGILLYGQGSQYGMGSVQIIGNVIVYNVAAPDGDGAGIYLWIGGAPLIENNIIAFNQAGSGGGIAMQNAGAPVIVQNLIAGNTALISGGGLDLEIPDGGNTATVVNNTIVGNKAGTGSGETGPNVYLSGFFGSVTFWNNIFAGLTENAVVYCDPGYGAPSPFFYNNDAFSPKGGDYAGACAGETGQSGNISANPQFVNPSKRNLQLMGTSPAVNTGNNSAPDLPSTDLAGKPRIVGGIIDMGAYEHQGTGK